MVDVGSVWVANLLGVGLPQALLDGVCAGGDNVQVRIMGGAVDANMGGYGRVRRGGGSRCPAALLLQGGEVVVGGKSRGLGVGPGLEFLQEREPVGVGAQGFDMLPSGSPLYAHMCGALRGTAVGKVVPSGEVGQVGVHMFEADESVSPVNLKLGFAMDGPFGCDCSKAVLVIVVGIYGTGI